MTDPDSCSCSAQNVISAGTACDRSDSVTGGAFLHFFLFSPGDGTDALVEYVRDMAAAA